GTRVAMGRNSPRISCGDSVLISHISWCGGPPPRKMLMTALCDEDVPARASARKTAARLKVVAPKEKAPGFKKLRRLMPSQYRLLGPKMVSMVGKPLSSRERRDTGVAGSRSPPLRTESGADFTLTKA